ncbi:GNAT family N-acetyltransferase [soil metagenome]
MSNPAVRIERVQTKEALTEFIECVYRIHLLESHWVPPLRRDMRLLLDRKKHPFHEHGEVEYFLAYEGDECVGRAAAIENRAHNEFHGEKIGFFGFLDAQPRQEIYNALLAAAEDWTRKRGLTALRGPCSFSTNEECGALVDGFDAFPALMTPWNTVGYHGFIEKAGFAKAMDLYSYWLSEDIYDNRMGRLAIKLKEKFARNGTPVVIRPINMKKFPEELERFRQIYNAAWEKNWGFVPMTSAEIDFMAKELKPLIVPELIQFAEIGGEPVGASFTVPDYNLVLRHLNGKLGLKEVAIFLLLRKRIHQIRVMTLGVVAEYRNRGLESMLVHETTEACRKMGIHSGEMGWVLETNDAMNRTMVSAGARRYRTHRIYEKTL